MQLDLWKFERKAKNRNDSKINILAYCEILIKERVTAFLIVRIPLVMGDISKEKFSTCAPLSLFTSEAKSHCDFEATKKSLLHQLWSLESWIAHTRTAKQLRHSCSSLARDGSGPASLRKKSNLAHQVTWPDLIQSPGSLGFMTNPHWGENSTCKTWLERSTGGPACYFFFVIDGASSSFSSSASQCLENNPKVSFYDNASVASYFYFFVYLSMTFDLLYAVKSLLSFEMDLFTS